MPFVLQQKFIIDTKRVVITCLCVYLVTTETPEFDKTNWPNIHSFVYIPRRWNVKLYNKRFKSGTS